MNEILVDTPTQDAYADALTLGPEPAVTDGSDITIERADVLMQFAVGDTGNVYWGDREYPMRPGTRHVNNICGVRFRSKQAGDPAIVNASLTGRAQPRLDPITPLPATGIGDALFQPGAAGTTIGPFDVGDWPSILMGCSCGALTNGARIQAVYPLPGGGQLYRNLQTLHAFGAAVGSAQRGLLVVQNLASQVSFQMDSNGATGGVTPVYFAAPCAFTKQQFWLGLGQNPDTLLSSATTAVPASGTVEWLLSPYKGIGQTIFNFSAGGGPFTVFLQAVDYTGAAGAFLLWQEGLAANQIVTFEHALISMPMVLGVTNASATTPGGVTIETVIKEAS